MTGRPRAKRWWQGKHRNWIVCRPGPAVDHCSETINCINMCVSCGLTLREISHDGAPTCLTECLQESLMSCYMLIPAARQTTTMTDQPSPCHYAPACNVPSPRMNNSCLCLPNLQPNNACLCLFDCVQCHLQKNIIIKRCAVNSFPLA